MRPIRNKDLILHQHLIEKDIDVEWLSQIDIDKIWYESTVLNKDQFHCFLHIEKDVEEVA